MVNYADRFTPEQLDELYNFSFVKCSDEPLNFDSPVPATAPELSEDVRHILTALFDEHREKYPDEYLTPIEKALRAGEDAPADLGEIAGELEDLYLTFWHDVVFEIFKDRIEIKDDGTLWTKEWGANDTAPIVFDANTASLLITHQKLQGALLPQKNDTAYVIDIDNQLHITWNKDGTPVINTVSEEKINKLLERREIPADCADTELLEAFAGAVASAYICNMRDLITVDYPSFFKALGIKPGEKEHHRAQPMDRIKRLENIGGVLVERRKIQRVFVWIEIDEAEKTLTFKSPYLYSIMDMLKKEPAKISKSMENNRPTWKIYGVSYLGRTEMASAKDKITIQIAQYLITRMHQHGKKSEASRNPGKEYKDKKLVKCTVTYTEIIDACPRLREALKNNPKRGTQILHRSIIGPKYEPNKRAKAYYPHTKIEDYIKKYTRAYDYFKDLKIKVDPVTLRNLDNKITFTHHGYNGDAESFLHLPKIKGREAPVILDDMDATAPENTTRAEV